MVSVDEHLCAYYSKQVAERATRPLGVKRKTHLDEFIALCSEKRLRSVVEVGCGVGRDGKAMASSGLVYKGVDLTPAAVAMCRDIDLDVDVASAVALPFADNAFDAGWCMSTLMHLRGDDIGTALTELRRVIRVGGVLEVGVWGADEHREWTDEHDRYFQSRTDADLREILSAVGTVTAFETWDRFHDGGHYQWARLVIS